MAFVIADFRIGSPVDDSEPPNKKARKESIAIYGAKMTRR
jgi:hypothetical protein